MQEGNKEAIGVTLMQDFPHFKKKKLDLAATNSYSLCLCADTFALICWIPDENPWPSLHMMESTTRRVCALLS